LPMPHMLPAPPKSSETRAIMLLISPDSQHLQVWPDALRCPRSGRRSFI
jgi:hypothetical protein